MNLVVIPVIKPHSHKLYIVRGVIDIVYITASTLSNMKYKVTKQSCIFKNFKPQEAIVQSLMDLNENDSIV